ncbi:putative quinol monooxygenase [Flavilitoribacter nigricans]|uniref:ABM domain-containing protein n=1 Tax=Flavilitoribacter nigricans (strain ATCC 23147 / DSM 23189 / NBRC 102662 / NCIMB 1420 / SS-2) TaxID=1122177 RepID=A0A2D0MYN1_FLAN2|nr:antibiotic biosynthesis monooxygenase [Flavilitoribacter nigricans]PHN01355.1 hypothetical protein CRP01_37455 [Flavilitoribacter nigricans DSM 23189 = NBRC 102662]
MDPLQVIVTMHIHAGKSEELKNIATKCMASSREKDPGTLQYDWYFNPDETVCTVIERYQSSEALLAHIGNLGELFGQILAITDFYPAVFGEPSEALVQATAALQPKVHQLYQAL